MAEQPPRKWQVASSNLAVGSKRMRKFGALKAWTQFYELRKRHLRLLRSLKPAEWRRGGTLTPVGKISIAGLVRHMAAHDAMPTAQIARRLSGRAS